LFTPRRGGICPPTLRGLGVPIKLARDSFRTSIEKAIDEMGLKDSIVEIDARDSASFFSLIFETPTLARKAVMAAESGRFVFKIADKQHKITLRRDKPRPKGEKRMANEASKFVAGVMEDIKNMFAGDIVSITPYAKQGNDDHRIRQIYRESRASFVRNVVMELNIVADKLVHVAIVLQGVPAGVRDTHAAKLLEISRAAMVTSCPVDIAAMIDASTLPTPTRSSKMPTTTVSAVDGTEARVAGAEGEASTPSTAAPSSGSAPRRRAAVEGAALGDPMNADTGVKRRLQNDFEDEDVNDAMNDAEPVVVAESIVVG